MNELQEKLVSMLDWFHNFCCDKEVGYFVLGGTAIGAVRHRGFIPWDDDIDVGLFREDYDRLISMSEEINKSGRYRIEHYHNRLDHIYPYAKLYDLNTTLVENTKYKQKKGIYIDIFPLDNIEGNSFKESERRFKKINMKVMFLCTRVCALRKGRNLFKNASILISRLIPDVILPLNKLIKRLDKNFVTWADDDCTYVANFAGNWHEKEIMKKEWYGTPKLYDFENIKVYGPENIDAYLKRQYGNYMKLPPKEKQITHHDYIYINLNEGYESEGV